MQTKTVTLQIAIAELSSDVFVAFTKVGDVLVRGSAGSNEFEAIIGLFWKFINNRSEDEGIALRLEVAGSGLEEALKQLTSSDEKAKEG